MVKNSVYGCVIDSHPASKVVNGIRLSVEVDMIDAKILRAPAESYEAVWLVISRCQITALERNARDAEGT